MENVDVTSLEINPELGADGESTVWSSRASSWRRLLRPTLVVGTVLILIAVLLAVFAPMVARASPDSLSVTMLGRPTSTNWFGTDELGRDLFSRVIYAARVSLAVAFGAVALACVTGGVLGIVSGYFGGLVDIVVMRLLDILFAFPAILFAVSLVAALGPSVRNLILTIAILYTPRFARVARGPTLSVKERDFVTSARALGVGNARIIRAHVLPNILSPLIVETSLSLTIALLTEAALSFLGLGVQPPNPSWGGMISAARPYLLQAPWYVLFPGLSIMYCVLAFNLIGDGLHDALNPNLEP